MPQVSVIIPNYNHASYIQQRIDTVLSQTFQDFELIILDDCSTDTSRDVISRYKGHPKVSHIIFNETNSGSTFKQWNKGIALAKGSFIWLAESDDFTEPDFLETLVPILEKNEQIGIAYCQSYSVNDKNEVTWNWINWTKEMGTDLFAHDFVMNGAEYIKNFLIHRNTIPNASAAIFKKKIYETVGGADDKIKNCSDWLTWLKILLVSDVAFTAKSLNYFRRHNHSVIAMAVKQFNDQEYIEIHDRTMRKAFKQHMKAVSGYRVKFPEVIAQNNSYIITETGMEGIHHINHKKPLAGWAKLVKASLDRRTLNFVRKLWAGSQKNKLASHTTISI